MQRIKALFAPRDMTKGAPWKSILMFAVPMLIGNFAQQLYNTVDSAVVGKYVGDNALAAVSSTMPILNLLLALFVVGLEVIGDLSRDGAVHLGWSVYAGIPLAVIALIAFALQQNKGLKEEIRKRLFV